MLKYWMPKLPKSIGVELIKSVCVMELGSSISVLESVSYVQFLEGYAPLDSKIGIFAQAYKKAKRYNGN